MADRNNISDEDYLDSLLKSVTAGSSSDELNNDFDNSIEDDFVKSIENDLKSNEDEEKFLDEFENDMFMSADGSDSSSLDIEPLSNAIPAPKEANKKKGLFGRNKKNKIVVKESDDADFENTNEPVISEANTSTPNISEPEISEPEISEPELGAPEFSIPNINESEIFDADNSNAALEELLGGEIPDASDNTMDEQNLDFSDALGLIEDLGLSDLDFGEELEDGKTDAVADAVADAVNEADESSPEEDINGLLDILGGSEEEEEPIKTKKKKKKKGLFGKKRKKNEDDQEADQEMDDGEAIDQEHEFNNENSEALDAAEDMASKDDALDFGIAIDDMGFDAQEEKTLDENEELIRKMDNGEIDEDELLEDEEEEPKKKKEKKKKEKKPKVKKEKKPKKVKVKKPKKPDVIIPIPRTFLIFALSFIVLFIVFLIFGGKLYYYNTQMQSATSHYVNKEYSKAYDELSGMSIKDDDVNFYQQVQTVMFVMHHYEAGVTLAKLDDYEHGLDDLIKGVAAYDKYQNVGRDLDCFDEMTEVLALINNELETVYGITESQARELSLLEDRADYAYKVRVLAKSARESNMEEQQDDSNN